MCRSNDLTQKLTVIFEGRKIAIATMHKKDEVMSPLLSKAFNIDLVVPSINTDCLGTFSGEIERKGSLIETARKKCDMAMNVSVCDIAVSSEGSFGIHPALFFTHANEELVLLVDRKNNYEFFGKAITTETNFAGSLIKSKEEAVAFTRKIGFPEHAVILKDREKNFKIAKKGICSEAELEYALQEMFRNHCEVWIETDMRAMYNPTRMKAIKKATENLIEKLNSICPECHFPGFWIVEKKSGLLCQNCNLPTKSIQSHIYTCKKCTFSEIKQFPDGILYEDPMYCDFCNP